MRSYNLGHRETLSFPMDQNQKDNLGETLLVSPRVGNDHGYAAPSDAVYIAQVAEIPELRSKVEANIWPTAYLDAHIPEGDGSLSPILAQYLELNESDPGKCADTVRMDHPFDMWDLVIKPYAMAEGIAYKSAASHQGLPFVESVEACALAHTMVAAGLSKAFDVKYALGVCRPIEFYDPQLQRFETPNHPECPAGHGAFSGASSKAFETIFDASQAQIDAVRLATKQFAMFRSFSAMHIPYSNLLGWQVGYEA